MKHLYFVFLISVLCILKSEAQENFVLLGKVYDFKTKKDLPGAIVQIMTTDSTIIAQEEASNLWINGDRSGETSEFSIVIPRKEGEYIIKCTYTGYETTYMNYTLDDIGKRETRRDLPRILMREETQLLDQVVVSATQVKFYYRGDTMVYNASAFVLSEGSMLDALVRQLPGVEIRENGDIYHNGRLVENLLLNGKDFFRDDKTVMLDNLPTYMVKNIEVYDKLGDRSKFLGYELPGDKEYVMDVKLKKEYSIGWIANAEAGGGFADRNYKGDNPYLARLFMLRFTDHSRFALYANANNLSDERKPGGNDGWTPQNMNSGTLTQQRTGVDYNIDPVSTRWKLNGNVNFKHSIHKDDESIQRTNFLATGDTYERIEKSNRNKNISLSTNHNLNLTFKRIMLSIRPDFSYNKFDVTSSMQSEAYGDTTINRYLSSGLARGYDWNAGLNASSVIKFPKNTLDNLEATVNARYSTRKDDTFNRYSLYAGSASDPAQRADQYFKNHPDRRYSAEGAVTYNRSINKLFYMALKYSLKHSGTERSSNLYRLDQLAGYDEGDIGILPSAVEYEQVIDRNNSYTSKLYATSNTLTPSFTFRKTTSKGKWYCEFSMPIDLKHERLDYRRGDIDTTLSRSSLLVGLYNTFMTWESKVNRTQIGLWYTINSTTPDMQYMVNIHDDTDPLNIREGNAGLKNSYRHSWSFFYHKLKKVDHRIRGNISFTHNAIAMGYNYDTSTGVRTYRAYNIDGNWNADVGYEMDYDIDKKKYVHLSSITRISHMQNVDLIGINSEGMRRSNVRTEGINETIKLNCRIGKQHIGAKFDGKWRYVHSTRQDFNNMNIWDFNYGLTGNFSLLPKLQLSTDITMYSRRGYSEPSLNTNDLVWNARISYTMMKGNMVLMLDGFDILGNLSNITSSLNGQGRTEIRRNVLPQYVLFHVQYKLNILPKNKR